MKRYLLIPIFVFLGFLLANAETYTFTGINLAANSTNSSFSEIVSFGDYAGIDGFRLYLTGTANAGTTNGNLTVIALTSPDGNTWDTANSSTNSGLVQIILKAGGTTVNGGTNTTSDFYSGYGIKKMKFIFQNSAPGSWTNVYPSISYRQK